MIKSYLEAAMRRGKYEILEEDNSFYGEIPGFQGVYANEPTLEKCRQALEETLEEWILFKVSRKLPLPIVNGIKLSIKKAG